MKNPMVRTQTCRGLFAGLGAIVLLAALITAAPFHAALAQTAPSLGTAQTFAVVAETVTNTGPTVLDGNLGVSPGAILPTGFPPGSLNPPFTQEIGNGVSLQAKSDARTAYNDLFSQACTTTYLIPTDIGALTLVPGVYCFASSAGLTGPVPLTLDGEGDPDAVWVFKTVSTLITGPDSSVVMSNGGQECNVFWQVGSSATLDTNTQFIGTILAHTSISLNSGANVSGRLLAGMQANGSGAVTMINNHITPAVCSVAVAPTLIKTFNPNPINVTGGAIPNTSTLTITLSNSNSTNITGATLSDTLPAGVTFVGSASTTCANTTFISTSGSVNMTGATIPANSFCTVTGTVTSSTAGPYVNTATLTSDQGGASDSETLTVLVAPPPAPIAPTLSKTFAPTSINVTGGSLPDTSTLTITLGNTNGSNANFASFTDTLPIGVTFVGSASNNGCGGTIANDANTVTWTTLGFIPPGGCTVTATVTSSVPGLHLNTTGALVTDKGTAPPAGDTLIVNPAPTLPIGIQKSFNSPINTGGVSLLTITVTNPNTEPAIDAPVAFIDSLPSVPGQMLVATGPLALTNTCGGTLTATTGSSSVIYEGGLLPVGESCTVTVYVTALTPGIYTNSLGTIFADLEVIGPALPGLLLEKTAIPTTYTKVGDIIAYTYTITNTGGVTLTGPFTVTDDNLGTFTCGTGTLAPGDSLTCTRNYTVQAGDLANVTSLPTGVTATISTGGWLKGVMSTLDTTITNAGPGVPNGIYPGWCIQVDEAYGLHKQPAKLYSTIGGSLPPDVALLPWNKINYILNHKIGVPNKLQFFKDVQTAIWVVLGEPDPPLGISANAKKMINAANANPNFVPGLGDVVAVIIYSDGILSGNDKIQETICEMRPSGVIINHATAKVKYGTKFVQSGEAQATVYQIAPPPPAPKPPKPPKLSKSFCPATIKQSGVSTLTITLTNPNSAVANLTEDLIDTFPSGVVVDGSPSTSCVGGTGVSATTSSVTLASGASIPANGSCKVTVNVTANKKGIYCNKLPIGALKTDKGSNTAAASATLTVKTNSWW